MAKKKNKKASTAKCQLSSPKKAVVSTAKCQLSSSKKAAASTAKCQLSSIDITMADVAGAGAGTYDATTSGTKRRQISVGSLKSEDSILDPAKRAQLLANTRDLDRNFALSAWAIRKHLDYVTDFTFAARTGDARLDASLESLMNWWSKPYNCDIAGRHDLDSIIRLLEHRAVVDGDVLIIKTKFGHLQIIEADRIINPEKASAQYVNGVCLDSSGKPLKFNITFRDGSDPVEVDAAFCVQHGYFQRFDQVRGISPLAPALNAFRDVYEGYSFALCKVKMAQMLGYAVYRNSSDAIDGNYPDIPINGAPWQLEFSQGDKVEMIESKTPAMETQELLKQIISQAIKALDIPYSFVDVSSTTYSGGRQDWLSYDRAAESKRNRLRRVLDELTTWRIGLWIADGYLPEAKYKWEWISSGIPWIDPVKEANSKISLIQAGLTSRQRVCKADGIEWSDIAAELAAEEKVINSKPALISDDEESNDE